MKTKFCLSFIAVALLITVILLNCGITDSSVKTINVNNSSGVAKNQMSTQKANKNINTNTTSSANTEKSEVSSDTMKGLWVTYMELDMSNTSRSYNDFKNKFDNIADTASEYGFNTLIVQVRPFSDALYDSEYFPYSHIISGKQGENPGYDPLKYMCSKCRKNNLKIHAWINPYRISTNETPDELSTDNPYIKDKTLGVETDNGIYYNPALKKVQDLIVNGVKEIVEKYNVDGIQFDDYFYPTKEKNFDADEYNSYVKAQENNCPSLSSWRKENVNKMVKAAYSAIHSVNDNVVFGISPGGNIKNNSEIYADVKSWCSKKGYIDYICPQIYYSLDNPALAYEDAIAQWKKLKINREIKIYSGLAGYKAGTSDDEGTWEDFNDILKQEYQIAEENKYDGIMLYSYNSLTEKSAKKEIENLKKVLNEN